MQHDWERDVRAIARGIMWPEFMDYAEYAKAETAQEAYERFDGRILGTWMGAVNMDWSTRMDCALELVPEAQAVFADFWLEPGSPWLRAEVLMREFRASPQTAVATGTFYYARNEISEMLRDRVADAENRRLRKPQAIMRLRLAALLLAGALDAPTGRLGLRQAASLWAQLRSGEPVGPTYQWQKQRAGNMFRQHVSWDALREKTQWRLTHP